MQDIISIHAPVKGATVWIYQQPFFDILISIHAPVKGATFRILDFLDVNNLISIHAPVKGATTIGISRTTTTFYFNPRTREGCDSNTLLSLMDEAIFQSTHP